MQDGSTRRWRLPRPQASLRGRLICLLLIAAFPVVVLVLAGAYAGYRGSLRQAERDLVLERDLVVASLSTRIAAADGALRGVAATWPEGWTGCGDRLRGLTPVGVVLDVECPAPAEGLAGTPAAMVRPALDPAGPSLILTQGTGTIAVLRALPGAGRLLVARVAPPPLPAGLLAWLVDGEARSWPIGPQTADYGPAPPQIAATGATRITLGEVPLVAARGRLSAQAFLVVARPAAPMRATAMMIATQRLGEVGALLGLSILAVVLGANYAVTRPLSQLRRAVAAWRGGGGTFEVPGVDGMPDEIRELAESFRAGATALAARERDLQAAIERSEILAAEVHHRVKNNLQIVSSLLALQAQRVTDGQARTEFEAARDRIGALATLHRHMYAHHDPEAIDLGAFIEELGVQLFAAIGDKPGRRIALDVAAPALRISSDQAVPLALIITEAVAAALKQGFPPGHGGRIRITVTADERRASLAIEDDGVVPRPDDQLRALLLRGLARQLGAELKREEAGLALDFPLRAPTPRPPPSVRPPSSRPARPDPARPGPSAPA
ncbi:sensor histidine kinase [Falsiroseomonas selenitidurans]|uniref:histidine kinase n=1 Tax=Falsiroseomonas selenitidurans TaxID=2716335 RepID=A0ABX1E821_9PROT|nr:sensor histidine kinase [Falsiroseomonas selenitidurans]NKC33051.1 sensor histidine kinase [Falsiroseomonas selenitidurans]